jgi:hypothetical protein
VTLRPDWLRADPGALTSAGIDMNAEGALPVVGALLSPDEVLAHLGRHRPNMFVLRPWTSILPIQGIEFLEYLCSLV